MISVFINSLTSGGAEKVVLTLLERFKRTNKSLELLMIEKDRFYDLPKDIPAKYLTTFESLESGPLKFPYLFVCAWRLKRSVKQPGQIVQSHLLRASFINVIAKWMGSPHHAQIVVHSRINFDHRSKRYRAFAKWLYYQIFRKADSVISICETMRLELNDYLSLGDHPMHRAIHNPHDINTIQENAAITPVDFCFDPARKYIISVGRLVKGKRVDDLIKAFAHLKTEEERTDLIIIGDGAERKNLEVMARDLDLSNCIHFLGFQQNPFAYIARANVLVLTSEWEGLPNVIVEALACGTAVLSSDCISGPREILHPRSDLRKQLKENLELGEFGMLYPVGHLDLLIKGLRQLLDQEQLRKSLTAKGLQRALDFDEAKIAAKYLATFKDILPPLGD